MTEATAEKASGCRRTLEGEVVGNGTEKTVTVLVRKKLMDKLYKKGSVRRCKYMVHDAEKAAHVGDWVRIEECRPISRRKRWRLIAVLEKAAQG